MRSLFANKIHQSGENSFMFVMSPACDIVINISLILFLFNIFAISHKRDHIALASTMPVEVKKYL